MDTYLKFFLVYASCGQQKIFHVSCFVSLHCHLPTDDGLPCCGQGENRSSGTESHHLLLMVQFPHTLLRLCLRKGKMAAAQTCYFPDGSEAPDDTPCHSASAGSGASPCCKSTAVCLDNTLCLSQIGWEDISRGTCTDRTWQSPECPQYCADGNNHPELPNAVQKSEKHSLILSLTFFSSPTRQWRRDISN